MTVRKLARSESSNLIHRLYQIWRLQGVVAIEVQCGRTNVLRQFGVEQVCMHSISTSEVPGIFTLPEVPKIPWSADKLRVSDSEVNVHRFSRPLQVRVCVPDAAADSGSLSAADRGERNQTDAAAIVGASD